MDWASQLPIIGEVALAMVLGGAIGVEREFADKPAGFRTHMLVAGAAALLVGLSAALVAEYAAHPNSDLLRFDPVRVVEAIVTGVSFLGAGTIFRRSETNHVEGLTTAASILLAAAVRHLRRAQAVRSGGCGDRSRAASLARNAAHREMAEH